MERSAQKIRNQASNSNEAAPDGRGRRRAPRREVETDAVVRNVFGKRAVGRVSDVSLHGCQIELQSGHLRVGQVVSLKVAKLESWMGMVRWGDSKVFGVEFAQRLHEPVVEHLAKTNPVVMVD